jgi:small subunit ribosomal protein S6
VRERIRNYEMMFIISPMQSNEEQVAATIQRIQQTIETQDGSVTSINHNPPWGRRKLSYPIRAYAGGEASRRNFTEGFYVLMHFTIGASKVSEIERTIHLTDHILRHLITIVEEPKKARSGRGGDLAYEGEPAANEGDADEGDADEEYDQEEDYDGDGDGDGDGDEKDAQHR